MYGHVSIDFNLCRGVSCRHVQLHMTDAHAISASRDLTLSDTGSHRRQSMTLTIESRHVVVSSEHKLALVTRECLTGPDSMPEKCLRMHEYMPET